VATITLNCAPIFRSLTARVGPNPVLSAQRTYLYPTEIKPVNTVPAPKDTDIVTAATSAILSQYTVNYNIPLGVGSTTPAAAATTQAGVAQKVFINCNTATHIAGTTVIGLVQANDAEGDDVTYFAYSGDMRVGGAAAAAMTAAAELHTVTNDGVIAISGVTEVVGVADPADPPADPNSGLITSSIAISTTLPRDVFIVAVDSRGAQSVLQARFYLACGQ